MKPPPQAYLFDAPRAACLLPAVLALFGLLFVAQAGGPDHSTTENRRLTALPDFSWRALADGTYTRDLDLYVSDRFPFRDSFVEVAFWLRQHRGPGSDGPAFYVVGNGSTADMERPDDWADPAGREDNGPEVAQLLDTDPENGEALDDEAGEGLGVLEETHEEGGLDFDAPASSKSAASRQLPADDVRATPIAAAAPPHGVVATPAATPAPAAAGPQVTKMNGRIENRNGILVYQGRAMQMFGGSAGAGRAYARTLNKYVEALQSKVRVYAMVIPTPAAFYLPESHKRRESEKRNIDNIYAALHPGIRGVDAFGELAKHTDEYLYLRTDHHWAARGAYHAYRAFCAAAGVPAAPIEGMVRKVKKNFLGTLYWYTRDDTVRKNPDEVEYFVPPVRYTAQRFLKNNLSHSVPTSFLNERAGGYGVFLGADYPLMVAKTSVGNGRRVLLVKNSYGNPFAVFLLSSFEKVVVVDYRYFQGALVDVIEREGITDLVFMNGAFSANTRYHRVRIGRVLYGGNPPRALGLPAAATPSTPGAARKP